LSPIKLLDSPPVEAVTDGQPVGIAATATETDATHETIELAAQCPKQRERIPAILTTDRFDDVP
jgi:hypothetical protein